ncbi:CRS2-associated factor 1, mitochondrial isoform X1 [Canna indica]|uniref:CRS2-associated factor 1, mitochondrial isoform X1 n=1 Tax=Canna indica TaxID=4628 RepID=A0AAQ3K467_9LILI|nr:CRS2-associated factor 1, mitochondrial isoform X1 [Canna indica]
MLSDPITHRNRTLAVLLAARRLISSSLPSLSPRLLDRYGFVPPPSLRPPNPDPNPNSSDDASAKSKSKKKKTKLPYKPPSSLDRAGQKPLHSNLPFDFRFSYTESNPNVKPIGLREPKYSPFGPDRIDRVWTGFSAPAVDPTVRSVDGDGPATVDLEKAKEMRAKALGEPLSPAERAILIEKCQKNRTKRQVNLGRDGLTHNMLNDIHNNWKNAEAVRIKCLGVPTVDMQNVCTQLEEKTGGLIIHRHGGQIILYRGRHYSPKRRPVIPLMLWKPHEPVYPRLIRTVIEGLTIEETKEMRKRGLAVPALTKLAKNGYYASLVPMVRDAFLTDELVRIDCKGLEKSDYKKIGVKLRDLVPCILVTFDKEQIVVWRGKNYNGNTHQRLEEQSLAQATESSISAVNCSPDSHDSSVVCTADPYSKDQATASSTV